MNSSKTPLKILSISYYGMDIPIDGGKIYSGTQKRQVDYAHFLEKYTILIPTHNKETEEKGSFYLVDNLEVIPVFITGPISFLFQAYKKAKEIIKKQKINALVCDNPHWSAILGVILKRKYHLPLLIHSMAEMINNKYYIRERKINYIKNIFSKINFKFTDFLRVSTKTEITNLSEQNFDKNKIIHAPFYIDFSKFETENFDQTFRKELLADKFDSIVLFVGRFALQKDLATYIKSIVETVKENPRVLFLLIGSGPEFENIKKLVKDLGIENNVSLLGKINYAEVAKYYKISDIFCATSIYEGTCMTLHEAAICKLPIVATRFAGAVDLIKDGENGFLADIGDYKAIAQKINYLVENKEKIKTMGEKNYNIIKNNFTKEQALEKYHQMFVKLDKLREKYGKN